MPTDPGDEPPAAGPDDADWLCLREDDRPPSTWPEQTIPAQLHLDCTVADIAALDSAHRRALELGATLRLDRSEDPEEPLRVYADPAGHPFCTFVA